MLDNYTILLVTDVSYVYHHDPPTDSAWFLACAILSPEFLQLHVPQGRIRDARKRNGHPGPDVAAIAPNLQSDRALIPDLIHADNGARPADEPGH